MAKVPELHTFIPFDGELHRLGAYLKVFINLVSNVLEMPCQTICISVQGNLWHLDYVETIKHKRSNFQSNEIPER